MYLEFLAIAFVFQMIFLGYLLVHFKGRISPYYYFLFISVMLTTFGYLLIASSTTVESALIANQTEYLGACFSPVFMMLCIADLCKVNIKKLVAVASCGFAGVLFALVSAVRKIDWYYKNTEIEIVSGIAHLRKEYGPLHFLFPLFLCAMVVVGLIFIIGSLNRRKDVSYKNSIILLFSLSMCVVGYACEKLVTDYDVLPFMYCGLELILIVVLHRISLYDIPYMSARMSLIDMSNGYILFDGKGNYLSSDDVAKLWFGELSELHVDRPIKKAYTPILQDLVKWCDGSSESQKTQYSVGEKIVVAHHSVLNDHRKKIHCIRLVDETEQIKYQHLVESYNKNLSEEVQRRTENMRSVHEDIIVSMANIVESRDKNTGGHVKRTSDVVKLFTDKLIEKGNIEGLDSFMCTRIAKAAPLHDFGKIGIPDDVLNKPGKFEPEEYEIMKGHSAKGAEIVEQILRNTDDDKFKKIAANVAHYHHEKWDGSGYPDHLKGEEIPLEARVMALADVFDALVSKRVYKDSFSYDKAFSIIEESAGSHFDPVIAKEFLECKTELMALYDSYED